MKYGVSDISVVPVRVEAADSGEMITQILFGEHFKIIEERAKWSKVRAAHDNYEGWVCKKQIVLISEEYYKELQRDKCICSAQLIGIAVHANSEAMTPMVMGSSLPGYKNGSFAINGVEYLYDGAVSSGEGISGMFGLQTLIEYAKNFQNAPYAWGGRSPFGIDCSGFTQLIYKLVGIQLPRDAYQQAEIGQTLSFVEEAAEGDLAFFDNEESKIIHVGIVLRDNHIIHASGKVRIDRLDHQGIYNVDTKDYSHKLRLIKNIISN